MTFDLAILSNPAIRERYDRIAKRGAAVTTALHDRFGKGRGEIQFAFSDDHAFNAYADRKGAAYLIEIAGPAPLLVILVFERLMSDPRLLPWVDTDTSEDSSQYDIPFIVDPLDFDRRSDWAINLSRDRGFAADFLADFTLTFILLHEAGHILCGHADVERAEGGYRLAEMFDISDIDTAGSERSRAWEADADSVASTLALDYVVELARATSHNERAARVFGRSNHIIECILSILVVALYALFAYLRGMRYAIGLATSHPHPFVRAHYVKDMLLKAALARWDLDLDYFGQALDDRLDEMLIVLEEVGLHDSSLFTEDYMKETDAALAEIEHLRNAYRSSATAWFAWDADKNADAP